MVGRYEIDWTGPTPSARYQGLGDDPARYQIEHRLGRVQVAELCAS